ncbi:MAG: anthrone oxygenase family protein [Pseudomonadota bacterium]
MSIWFFLLTQGAIISYALVGGVFRGVPMVLFIGMAPVSLLIAGYGGIVLGGQPGTLMMIAGLIYVVGCFGVTVCFNVLMNETLAGMETGLDATRDYWTETYLPRWTFWNSVRTAASALSAALLLVSLLWVNQLLTA